MKRFILFVMLCVALCTSCKHEDLIANDPSGGHMYIFKPAHDSLLNKVLVRTNGFGRGSYYTYGTNYRILLSPKLSPNTPIFGEGEENRATGFLVGDSYTIDELVSAESRFIALKDGYYICYPFACIEQYAQFLDIDWKDFYSVDPDTVPIHLITFKEHLDISEKTLVKLTGKSTLHFHGLSSKQITIEDVVKALNEIIEEGKVDKYCYGVYYQPL